MVVSKFPPKLRTSQEFKLCQERGRKKVTPSLVVWSSVSFASKGPRLGLIVSRKVGNAVKRNRIKRVLRHLWGSYAGQSGDWVFLVRPRSDLQSFERYVDQIKRDFTRVSQGCAR